MKKTKLPSIVALAVLTAITTVFWVIFSVYRIFSTKPEVTVPTEILEPLTPSLDTEALDKIQDAVFLEEDQIPETVSASQTPIATTAPSPTPTETPTATGLQTPSP